MNFVILIMLNHVAGFDLIEFPMNMAGFMSIDRASEEVLLWIYANQWIPLAIKYSVINSEKIDIMHFQ